MNKRVLKYMVLIGLVAIITLLIFCNSLSNYDKSHYTSDVVSGLILPNKYVDNETVELIIRKMAHLVEYALLGCVVILTVLRFRGDTGEKYYGTALFYVLAVAVIDEHIQSFSDRTSSTGDIILDFCGAILGFFIGWLLMKAYAKIKRYFQRAGQEKNDGREKTTRA